MEAAKALRTLWRHRLILGFGAVLAVVAGLFVAYRLPSLQSRSFHVGSATEQILLDTHASQIVQTNATGIDTLGPTATLLATVMTQGTIKQSIAHQAGLNPTKLATVAESATSGGSGSAAQVPPSDSYVRRPGTGILITQTLTNSAGDDLPIIQLQARASDVSAAVRIVDAAASGLNNYVLSAATAQNVPNRYQLRVAALGPPEATTSTSGPSMMLAAAAASFVFLLVCLGILLAAAISGGWRQAAARETEEMDDLKEEHPIAPKPSAPAPAFRRSSSGGAVLVPIRAGRSTASSNGSDPTA